MSMTAPRYLNDLIETLESVADWRDALRVKLAVAQLCFDTIGLSDEKLDELTHEVRSFKRVCLMLGERVPGSFTASKGRRAA